MKIKLLTPETFYLGGTVTIEVNGKTYNRKVYDRIGCDLYFRFKNHEFYFMDFIQHDEIEYDFGVNGYELESGTVKIKLV